MLARKQASPLSGRPDDPVWDAEWNRRFRLLLEFHDCKADDPNLWLQLAVRLALEHVPGLRERRSKIGRPRRDVVAARAARKDLLRRIEELELRNRLLR